VLAAALAAVAWVGLVYLPGLALCSALRPTASSVRNAAFAAPAGVGLTMAVAQLLAILGVAIRPVSVLPASLGVAAVAVVLGRRRFRRTSDDHVRDAKSPLTRILLLVAIAAGLLTWCASIPSVAAVLPNTDGAHHGLYAHRILQFHTIDPHIVLAGDVLTRTPSGSYYPIAIHLCAALISGVTGVAVNTVLTAGMVLSASVVLPLGTYVLNRRLFPDQPIVAGIAAILSATFAWFPFGPIIWGGLPLIVAMTQIPAGVDALCGAATDGRRALVGIALGLGAYGIFEEHPSELIAAVVFAGILIAMRWRETTRDHRRSLSVTVAVAAVTGGLLVAPDVAKLVGGVAERQADLGYQVVSSGISPVHWVLGVGNPLVLVFALIGLASAYRSRSQTGWMLCLVCTALLFLAASISAAPFRWLTAPWYSAAPRVSYLFAYFEAAFGAAGIVASGKRLSARLTPHGTRPRRGVMLIPVATLAVGYFAMVSVEAHAFVSIAYREGSKVSADQRAAFKWLASRVPSNARVLNDFPDGSGWMETIASVHPVFAVSPETVPGVDPAVDWGDRWYLLTHAANLQFDSRAQAAARRWNVQYVYVGGELIAHFKQRLLPTALAASGAYQVVWHRGPVTIFRVRTQLLGRG
jgi:hypothetical protein